MTPLYELESGASEFEFFLEKDLKALKKYRNEMQNQKDVSKIRDIAKELGRLEHDLTRYKKWADDKVEELERHEN